MGCLPADRDLREGRGGGLFAREWFDRHRAPNVGGTTAARIVSVDPAETGKADEAGIIAMSVTADSRAWVTDDRSGRMQSDEWARTAVLLALTTQATEVLFEATNLGGDDIDGLGGSDSISGLGADVAPVILPG